MKKEILLAVSCAFFGSCGYFSRSADDKGMVEDTVASRAVPSRGNAPGAELIRLFKSGIRTEAVDGSRRAVYIVFSPDSSKAELFGPAQGKPEMLDRRTLLSGGHVWNVEDDDTKNVRYADGCWTVSQRGKLLFRQSASDNDASLGPWEDSSYEGVLPAADCPGIRYQLDIRSRKHSGDGTFLLRLTYLEAENGKDAVYTYVGRRYTQRGIPSDKDAVVWQLVADRDEDVYNFLCDKDAQTLTLLNRDFEKNESGLNYSLTKIR